MAADKSDYGKLKALVDDLRERVHQLRLFDRRDEVNAFCDDLVAQVTLTVESTIERMNRIQAGLVEEINSYRKRLLEDQDDDDNEENQDEEPMDREIQVLVSEVDAFSATSSTWSNCEKGVIRMAEHFKARARELRRQMRQLAFRDGFMRLVESLPPDDALLGRLETTQKDVEDDLTVKHIVLDDWISKALVFELAPSQPDEPRSDQVTAMCMLDGGRLAVASTSSPIAVWSLESKQKLFELERECGRRGRVTSLVQLPGSSGGLASGDREGCIDIWDLAGRRHAGVLDRMRHGVISLEVLPGGQLVGFDGSVLVWQLGSEEESSSGQQPWRRLVHFSHPAYLYDEDKVRTPRDYFWYLAEDISAWNRLKERHKSYLSEYQALDGHRPGGRAHLDVNLAVLADGCLAFSYILPHGVTVEVREPDSDSLVRLVEVPGSDFESCTILPSGDVVLCLLDRTVQIRSLEDGKICHSFRNDKGPIVGVSQHGTPPGLTLAFIHLRNRKLPILEPRHLAHLHSYVDHVSISRDGKYLAIANNLSKLVLWPLQA